jgi:fatty-acyl-CoA synthase
VLVIETHPGSDLTGEAVLDYLAPRIARWQTPEAIVFAEIPMTATGKIDKKALREAYRARLAGEG